LCIITCLAEQGRSAPDCRLQSEVYQDPLLYGFAYGADGTIRDHHDHDIGVEQVYIARIAADAYKVRLISHERILPVWEGVMRLPAMDHVLSEPVAKNSAHRH
jgi:hypothetical protein